MYKCFQFHVEKDLNILLNDICVNFNEESEFKQKKNKKNLF